MRGCSATASVWANLRLNICAVRFGRSLMPTTMRRLSLLAWRVRCEGGNECLFVS